MKKGAHTALSRIYLLRHDAAAAAAAAAMNKSGAYKSGCDDIELRHKTAVLEGFYCYDIARSRREFFDEDAARI